MFGPLLLLTQFDNEHDAIEYINDNEKPLAVYIFTENMENAQKFIERTSSGGVCINGIEDHANGKWTIMYCS